MMCALGSCCEFGCCDDANAWRKSTKEADEHKIFYFNLESNKIGHSSRSSSIQRSKTTEEVSGNVKQF